MKLKNARTCNGCRALNAIKSESRMIDFQCELIGFRCSPKGKPLQPCPKPISAADYQIAVITKHNEYWR